jgi:hypothetical protein
MVGTALLWRRMAAGILIAASTCASVSGQSFRDLWTKNPRIRAGYFHVLFLHAESFPTNEARATGSALHTLIGKFKNDVSDFADNDPDLNEVEMARFSTGAVRDLPGFRNQLAAVAKIAQNTAQPSGNAPILLIYLLAHGFDDGGTIKLELSADKRVTRDELKAEVLRLRGLRLVVFVTDNCSEKVAGKGVPFSDPAGGVWRALYFGHQGFVDIQTSGKDQFAFVAANGSVFLNGLNTALSVESVPNLRAGINSKERSSRMEARREFVDYLDAPERGGNRDGLVSWDEFRGHLTNKVEEAAAATKDRLPAGSPVRELMRNGQTISIDTSRVKVLPPQR